MSPIPLSKQQNRFGTTVSDEKNDGMAVGMKTRGIRLGLSSSAKRGGDNSESYCFDSLHELCNLQIDELKKSLKLIS